MPVISSLIPIMLQPKVGRMPRLGRQGGGEKIGRSPLSPSPNEARATRARCAMAPHDVSLSACYVSPPHTPL